MRLLVSGVVLILAAVIFAVPVDSQETDLHALFESRCMACHGHAGEFARINLSVIDGEVTGASGQPLGPFLARHRGGLEPEEIQPLLEMFRKQIDSGALFQERCITCHDSARTFARLKLIMRDGVLVGRYSHRAVGAFLPGHGRLDTRQAAAMTDALAAILRGAR